MDVVTDTVETTLEPVDAMLGASRTGKARRTARVLYAAGDGNVLGTFEHWRDRKDDPTQLSVTYSGQFFDACERLGAQGIVLSHDAVTGDARHGRIRVKQRRLARFRYGPGPLYHLEQLWGAVRIAATAVWNRADVVVAASGAAHWFGLMVLPVLGVKVIPAVHCVLWPKFKKPGLIGRVVNKLDGMFFKRAAVRILTASGDIEGQLTELAGAGVAKKFMPFLPTYRVEHFPAVTAPANDGIFRVLYAGRIIREKGVFDLLETAIALSKQAAANVEFDICGTGHALDELKARIAAAGLSETVRCHGHCARPVMVEMFKRAHAVMVPTTTGFVEGFNQVVAEAILSGRPVITSSVCPAIHYVGDAVVVVPPDDVAAYTGAVLKLAGDAEFYGRCAAACRAAREQFFDESRGWAAALEAALCSAIPVLAR